MSMTGVINAINSKEIKTKYGLKKKYSVQIDGVWYEAGWKAPSVVEGTTVTFSTKDTAYGKEIDGALIPTVAGLGAGTSPSASPAPKVPTRGKYDASPFPVPPLDPSRSIIRQNALRHATATVTAFIEHNRAIPDSGSTTIKGVSTLCESVITAAKLYENYISGYDDLKEAEAEATKDA